eukprot:9570142-Ditylum_brightwellii.AAC.1
MSMVEPQGHARGVGWMGVCMAQQKARQNSGGGRQYFLYIQGACSRAGDALFWSSKGAAFWRSSGDMCGRESWRGVGPVPSLFSTV